jgi:hypothetical protein
VIAFLIYLFVLWLAWRLLCRWTSSHDVQIAPAPPTQVAVFTPSITIHVHLDRATIAAARRQNEGVK